MKLELQDRVAIVTGAAGGIGAATVRRFLAEGAKVLAVDRAREELDALVASLGSPDVRAFVADVSKGDEVRAYVDAAVAHFGGVDVMFANAGVEGMVRPLVEFPEAEFDRVLAVNVKGPLLAMQRAAPEMAKRGGGSIVVTASIAGLIGSPGMAAYITSKHALLGLVKTAAIELAAMNVRVNAIAPGPVDNRMMRSLEAQSAPENPEAVKAGFTAQVPMGRYARNEEIAEMALFLASPRSSYSTGAVFVADGGFVTH